ncbi:MAG: hypothetical protein R2865_14150 [Deinococcales bacterium]
MRRTRWLSHLLLIVACFIIASPVIFALIKASQTRAAVMSPSLMPGSEFWNNLRIVWFNANLGNFMKNSFLIAIIVTTGKTILSLLAGMALVFFRFPLKPFIFGFILFTLMMPTEVLIVGLFDLISLKPPPSWQAFWEWFRHPKQVLLEPVKYGFNWANNYLAIIVPFLASATGTFLFRQHFLSIPKA